MKLLRLATAAAAFAAAVALALAGQGLQPARAAGAATGGVVWDNASLKQIYNPPGDRYAYAPSVVVDGSTKHIFTCHNQDSGVIRDYIYYTKLVSGVVQSSTAVLSPPASGRFDSFHTCDPSVVRSNVSYNGSNYSWVMFYTGNDQACSCNNQIGVAVANDIAGPWTRTTSPLITWSGGSSYLGILQPSATSIDGNGRIFLAYHEEGAAGLKQFTREVNISNLNSPTLGAATQVPTAGAGTTGEDTGGQVNIDIAYDSSRERFYAIGEQTPFPSTSPGYVDLTAHVWSIDGTGLRNGTGTWRLENSITQRLSGWPRNHNAGLDRNQYGGLVNSSTLTATFSVSCAANDSAHPCGSTLPEWTYDLWEISGTLDANYLLNNGFQDSGAQQTVPSWSTWGGSSGIHADADFVEASGYASSQRLTHYKSSAYEVYTGQTVSVPNGTYTLRAWAVSGGGQSSVYLEAKDFGGAAKTVTIPTTGWPNWTQLTISNIVVTNGSATVGAYSNAPGGSWMSLDGVELYRQ